MVVVLAAGHPPSQIAICGGTWLLVLFKTTHINII
jgi:hypothetical protein